uniref:Uncharacterized protein n=1 Tax=Siphoviridae sp. ctK0l2 TaxID=2826243 RepID=A0A8S5NL33_9CAUD|nr:MAG TPA: hypothetical protein [Siphoviridae sp. ctK0l2]
MPIHQLKFFGTISPQLYISPCPNSSIHHSCLFKNRPNGLFLVFDIIRII